MGLTPTGGHCEVHVIRTDEERMIAPCPPVSIVVDALPPRAAGRMCSIDDPALVPERHKLPCNRRGGGCARNLPVAQEML
jgi:hypothetical protein